MYMVYIIRTISGGHVPAHLLEHGPYIPRYRRVAPVPRTLRRGINKKTSSLCALRFCYVYKKG